MKRIKFDFWVILSSIILTVLIVVCSGNESEFINLFGFYIDPTIGILTFLIATLIAYRSWTEKLPKKITVHFKYNDEYIFTCHKAYLAGEGDIRQWGQQIGKQMNEQKNLDFYPYIKENIPKVEYSKNGQIKKGGYLKWLISSHFYKHYTVTFFLSKQPENYTNRYKVWWDNDSDTPKNKEIILSNGNRNIVKQNEAREIWQKENKKASKINMNKKLLNLSNHPSSKWTEKQLTAVKQQFDDVEDMPFPNVLPNLSSEELDNLVGEYQRKIKEKNITNIHIAGEPTFVFRLVTVLKREGLKCYASTTERIVTEKGNEKTSTFQFIQFREY